MAKIIASLLGLGVIGGAIALLLTNPNSQDYEAYAVTQLQERLDQELCEDVPAFLGDACGSVIASNDVVLEAVVESSTTRRNFYVFSLYETDLDPVEVLGQVLPNNLALSIGSSEGIPAYRVETVGLFGRFFTYGTEER